jgi:hypothetical protein
MPTGPRNPKSVRLYKKSSARPKSLAGAQTRLNETIADGAVAFLARYPQDIANLTLMKRDPSAWLERTIQNYTKISRKQHVRQLALTYAMIVQALQDGEYREAIVNLAHKKRTKITKQTHIADLFVELMFTYGEDTDANRKKYRGLYNRDAHAIRYLFAAGIPPDKVEELATEKGEGPDRWSRKRAAAEARLQSEALDGTREQNANARSDQLKVRVSGQVDTSCTLPGTDAMTQIVECAIDLLKHVGQHVSNASQAASEIDQAATEHVQISRHKCRLLAELCDRALSNPNEQTLSAILEVEISDQWMADVLTMSKEEWARITVKRQEGLDGWARIIATKNRIHSPTGE